MTGCCFCARVGQALLRAREARGLSIVDATEAVGWTTSKLRHIEQGRVEMRLHDVMRLCESYKISLSVLLFSEMEALYSEQMHSFLRCRFPYMSQADQEVILDLIRSNSN